VTTNRRLTRRRALAILAIVLVVAAAIVARQSWTAIETMRPLQGSGVVLGKSDERGRAVILELEGGGRLPVLAISSRIDAGDRVEKRAGELDYVINGRRVNPVGTVVGSLLFFWIFLPVLAFLPVLILLKTKEG
jgi:hypothetical protein